MKKIVSGSLVVVAIASLVFSVGKVAYAACGSSFQVGAKATPISGCAGSGAQQQIKGFSIDVEKNKITLKNYNGGAIYYFCRSTCESAKEMEIELIGDNTVTSDSSSSYLSDASVPKNAAFINIIPKFTGKGTLKIKAGQPIAFEAGNSKSFTIKAVGADYEMTGAESADGDESEAASAEPAEEEEPEAADAEVAEEEEPEVVAVVKKEESKKSFFETPLGIALLIAVPSLLVIVIIVLLVALLKKNKKGNNNASVGE